MSSALRTSASPHHPIGLEFKEPMKGTAVVDGKRVPVSVQLRAHVEDIDQFQADPQRAATLEGTMTIGDRQVPVSGSLHVMERGDPAKGEVGHFLEYRLETPPGVEPPVRFAGAKQVKNDRGLDLTSDLTQLRGNFVPPGKPLDGKAESKNPSVELRFQWTNPLVMAPFLASFKATEGDHYAPEHNLEARAKFAKVWGAGILSEWVPFLGSSLGWSVR